MMIQKAVNFLLEFEGGDDRPEKSQMDKVLDPVTAGAIIKTWVTQLKHPIIPFEVYNEFLNTAELIDDDPSELVSSLRELISTLSERNR